MVQLGGGATYTEECEKRAGCLSLGNHISATVTCVCYFTSRIVMQDDESCTLGTIITSVTPYSR